MALGKVYLNNRKAKKGAQKRHSKIRAELFDHGRSVYFIRWFFL